MKRFTILSVIWVYACLCFAQKDVLNQFFNNLEQNTLQSQFTLTVSDDINQPMHFNGEITMHGDKFYLTMGDIEVSYDGKTLYHYDEGLDELTLSNPTMQEITESNPLLYAKAVAELCELRYSGKTNENSYVIDFIPNDATMGVSNFSITLRKSDLLPINAIMKENITSTTILELKQPKYITYTPSFTISKEGAEINDLR